jgi:histidinol-phosphate/aromatic aminotransferase/cobyric acid decarboxylase-like protein
MKDSSMSYQSRRKARIAIAKPGDRLGIYAMRHEVYAQELGQHQTNPDHMLSDSLDSFNEYITAHIDGRLAGFISITPPCCGQYSIDKYISRDALPVPFDDTLYELRILTVAKEHRSSRLAAILMYAAFRWVEEREGKHIVALGRTDVLSIYLKHGLQPLNQRIKAGAVTFELLTTTVKELRGFAELHHRYYKKLWSEVIWDVDFPFFKPACCFHGGAFFDAIGTSFDSLQRRNRIINADVLDAWFPPSPRVLDTIREHLPWLMSTSPPTPSDGLRAVIARFRGVDEQNILPGAGSSDLIYLAFRQWLDASSRVLTLDPTYGEYAHIFENVIGCKVHRLVLQRRDQYALDLDELASQIRRGYDLIVLVNPNNPTGQLIPRNALEKVLTGVPASTRVWVDEAYIDYAGPGESLEPFAARSENIIVCKSMSKVYALSGTRAAYLCAPMHQLADLISITPPWAVSLPAQVAAVRALEDENYYAERYRETRLLRAELIAGLRSIGIAEILPSTANFVMCHLEPWHSTAAVVVSESRKYGLFLRDTALMGSELGSRALRIAVKNKETNTMIVQTLDTVLCAGRLARA